MSKPRVFFALPIYTGLQPRTLNSLLLSVPTVESQVSVVAGCAEIARARAELVSSFLRSGSEFLFFVDADIGFGPEVLKDLIRSGFPIVVAAYRERVNQNNWTVDGGKPLTELPISRAHPWQLRTIPIERAGLGCTLIRRDVLETMSHSKDYENLCYINETSQESVCDLFSSLILRDSAGVRRRLSEDAAFYCRAIEQGFRPQCLIDATIDHSGVIANLGQTLDMVHARR